MHLNEQETKKSSVLEHSKLFSIPKGNPQNKTSNQLTYGTTLHKKSWHPEGQRLNLKNARNNVYDDNTDNDKNSHFHLVCGTAIHPPPAELVSPLHAPQQLVVRLSRHTQIEINASDH